MLVKNRDTEMNNLKIKFNVHESFNTFKMNTSFVIPPLYNLCCLDI